MVKRDELKRGIIYLADGESISVVMDGIDWIFSVSRSGLRTVNEVFVNSVSKKHNAVLVSHKNMTRWGMVISEIITKINLKIRNTICGATLITLGNTWWLGSVVRDSGSYQLYKEIFTGWAINTRLLSVTV